MAVVKKNLLGIKKYNQQEWRYFNDSSKSIAGKDSNLDNNSFIISFKNTFS
jgi:hypothetical protein